MKTIELLKIKSATLNEDSTVTLTMELKYLEQIVKAFQSHQDEGVRFSGFGLFSVLLDCQKKLNKGE